MHQIRGNNFAREIRNVNYVPSFWFIISLQLSSVMAFDNKVDMDAIALETLSSIFLFFFVLFFFFYSYWMCMLGSKFSSSLNRLKSSRFYSTIKPYSFNLCEMLVRPHEQKVKTYFIVRRFFLCSFCFVEPFISFFFFFCFLRQFLRHFK